MLQQNIRLYNNLICHRAVEQNELHETFGWTNGSRSQYAFSELGRPESNTDIQIRTITIDIWQECWL